MTHKENYLKIVHFERPDYINMCAVINAACWNFYPQEFLCEQMEKHPKRWRIGTVLQITRGRTPMSVTD